MLGCLGDFVILSAILYFELSLIYKPKFWNYYDVSITRKELTICPIKFCKCRAVSRWFHDLECNYRLWIVTQIWYELKFWNYYDASMTRRNWRISEPRFWNYKMPRWPERNWRIFFVPLNFVNICDFKEN